MSTQPPAAFTRRTPDPEAGKIDPLRFCVATTVAAIAWLITPPLAVVVFASLGLYSYFRAYRAGVLKSRCLLGDTRLVMVYLAVLWLAGVGATVWSMVR